jgi:hypothetical protein
MLFTGILIVMIVTSDMLWPTRGRDKIKTVDRTEQASMLLLHHPWDFFLWPQFIMASHRMVLMFRALLEY